MDTTQLRTFLSKIENLRKTGIWLELKKKETGSKITDKDIRELVFKLGKENVSLVAKELDSNFDDHFDKPQTVADIYYKKLKELKKGAGFTDEEKKIISYKIKYIENLIDQRLFELGKNKTENNRTPLKDFFTDNTSQELITAIQERFKNSTGKKMAILIFLLHKKYNLITYDLNDRKKNSRSHFVRALTETEVKNIKGVNNFFKPITGETSVNEKDEVYLKIDKQLKEMVSTG